MWNNTRRKVQLVLLFFLILFSFAAVSTGFWIHWTVITSVFVVLFIADLMFLDDSSFVYDVQRESWAQRTGTNVADY